MLNLQPNSKKQQSNYKEVDFHSSMTPTTTTTRAKPRSLFFLFNNAIR